MNRIELSRGLEPRIDQLSKKVRELRENGHRSADGLDNALIAVERSGGRREAAEAAMSLRGLSSELPLQGAQLHGLDPARVADLISDPFADD
ncbi:MAG: hypothetical protein KUA35_01015 [Pseudodesulfovibrio sp.]|uniref:Uncharacterized protein n=1 Tax=Pseudodesulfovibrio aespoeensis (strain ATCC 700646 / DSM 10631 / Aspo-2) TaxID=643562 RepID=E6VV46_PSEA9|nr:MULTISPECIES: hypothetical protein [Pseudodesulfovibrio]MBU4191465.1 hypothetical protein [Pseudomonadota bacterium]ADU61197.1 hypothetical protein Daes_0170 [Pseudodesulfovibrio aespoeensis Aspo-2]MBU4245280.1 hypothetical protein [Pseudomonadota bacterium]MBU4379238.1 hypothetical protein [Pseudomonadota bacterium]MBU4476648.1 hypothetical protein [Pseudomonadota bacterium]